MLIKCKECEAQISDKFCKGSFVLEIDEEKTIKTCCVITVPSKRYNLFVNNEVY
jgi:hypothetical protein